MSLFWILFCLFAGYGVGRFHQYSRDMERINYLTGLAMKLGGIRIGGKR